MRTLIVASPAAVRLAAELIGAARPSAAPLAAVVLGAGAGTACTELVQYGADEVFWCEDSALDASPAEAGLAALAAACAEYAPDLLLFPSDAASREWAPRLASRLGAGLVTECIGWDAVPGGRLHFRRTVYGGKAVAAVALRTPVQAAVVRAGAFSAPNPDPNRTGSVRKLEVAIEPAPSWPEVVERRANAGDGPALTSAPIIVSGGRGLGSAENFALLEELAGILGAAVGASRAAVDEGWIPASRQIGQTGASVRPDLYIAVGISGASHHMAGLTGAKTIVAINTDAGAPIFEAARLGVVDDYSGVVRGLIDALRER